MLLKKMIAGSWLKGVVRKRILLGVLFLRLRYSTFKEDNRFFSSMVNLLSGTSVSRKELQTFSGSKMSRELKRFKI